MQSGIVSSRRDAEKRFPFNCSNNVMTIGINIIVKCFMLKCDTHVVTCHLNGLISFLFFLLQQLFNMIDVTY